MSLWTRAVWVWSCLVGAQMLLKGAFSLDIINQVREECQWKLQWDEPFDALSSTSWQTLRSDSTCQDGGVCYSEDSVHVDHNGTLFLTAKVVEHEVDGTTRKVVQSGSVVLDPLFINGKIIIRAKFPKGHGLVPRLGLVSLSNESSMRAEIDVAIMNSSSSLRDEMYAGARYIQNGTMKSSGSGMIKLPCIEDFTEKYHTFEVHKENNTVTWLVDEVIVHEHVLPKALENVTFQIVVNLAVAREQHTDEISVSSDFEIDFIRLFNRTASKDGSISCPYSYINPGNCPLIGNLESHRNQYHYHTLEDNMFIHSKNVQLPTGSINGSLSYDEVTAFLNESVHTIRSQLEGEANDTSNRSTSFASLFSIGKSIENRTIYAMCLGIGCEKTTFSHSKAAVPQVLYTGMHHSREVLIYMVQFLVHHLLNGDGTEALFLLSSRQMVFVPIVNVDGYVYNYNESETNWVAPWNPETKWSGQRKNRRPGCSNSRYAGVDLNRNYALCFDIDDIGSEPGMCKEDYRGESAFSEPESLAIKRLVEANNFSIAFNFHSYGKFFNIPYACRQQGKPGGDDELVFNNLAAAYTKENHYRYGQSWAEDSLYAVNGEASDWMYNTHHIFAMSPEVGPKFSVGETQGFWPGQKNEMKEISQELLFSNIRAAFLAGPMYEINVTAVDLNATHAVVQTWFANSGLSWDGNLQAIGTQFMDENYTHSVSLTINKPPNDSYAMLQKARELRLEIPISDRNQQSFFIILRDSRSCVIYRLSVLGEQNSEWKKISLSTPQKQPLCGTCRNIHKAPPTDTSADFESVVQNENLCRGPLAQSMEFLLVQQVDNSSLDELSMLYDEIDTLARISRTGQNNSNQTISELPSTTSPSISPSPSPLPSPSLPQVSTPVPLPPSPSLPQTTTTTTLPPTTTSSPVPTSIETPNASPLKTPDASNLLTSAPNLTPDPSLLATESPMISLPPQVESNSSSHFNSSSSSEAYEPTKTQNLMIAALFSLLGLVIIVVLFRYLRSGKSHQSVTGSAEYEMVSTDDTLDLNSPRSRRNQMSPFVTV